MTVTDGWGTTLKRYYRRKRSGPPVIVVSGLPRSGTSMAMKMLDAGGLELHVDDVRKPDIDNPKGYYEFEQVKNLGLMLVHPGIELGLERSVRVQLRLSPIGRHVRAITLICRRVVSESGEADIGAGP